MHKQDLIDHLVRTQNLGKNEAGRIVNDIFETITETVAAGFDFTITGFGTFKTSKHAARVGRNPQTGEPLEIKAHTTPVFRAGKKFKDAVK